MHRHNVLRSTVPGFISPGCAGEAVVDTAWLYAYCCLPQHELGCLLGLLWGWLSTAGGLPYLSWAAYCQCGCVSECVVALPVPA